MDPNANLAEQRRIIARLADGGMGTEDTRRAAYRLADLAEAMDAWLSAGGFLPDAWKRSAGPTG